MRVIICGSSHWNYEPIVEDEIIKVRRQSWLEGTELLIIHGGEPGPETVVQNICKTIGIDQVMYPANRAFRGRALIRRNPITLQEHSIDLVLLFAHVINENTMVQDMLHRAQSKGIKTKSIDCEYLTKKNSGEVC